MNRSSSASVRWRFMAPALALSFAGLALAGCNEPGAAAYADRDRPLVVAQIGDCKVWRIRQHETYSGFVWTTICPSGRASTQSAEYGGAKVHHGEEVIIDTQREGSGSSERTAPSVGPSSPKTGCTR